MISLSRRRFVAFTAGAGAVAAAQQPQPPAPANQRRHGRQRPLGAKIADVRIKYRQHGDIDRMLQWQGPMQDLPPNLGRLRPPLEEDLSQYA